MFLFKSKKDDTKLKIHESKTDREARSGEELNGDKEKMILCLQKDLEWAENFLREEKELLESRNAIKNELENILIDCDRAHVVSEFISQQASSDHHDGTYSVAVYGKDYESIIGQSSEVSSHEMYVRSMLEEVIDNIEDAEDNIVRYTEQIDDINHDLDTHRRSLGVEIKDREVPVNEIDEERRSQKEMRSVDDSKVCSTTDKAIRFEDISETDNIGRCTAAVNELDVLIERIKSSVNTCDKKVDDDSDIVNKRSDEYSEFVMGRYDRLKSSIDTAKK